MTVSDLLSDRCDVSRRPPVQAMMAAMTTAAISLARLKKRREFLAVAKNGRKHAARGVVLQALRRPAGDGDGCGAGPGPEVIRVGFTVTRKVGGAVTRNRIKRRLRALAESILAHHAKPGWDYVLIGRAATRDRAFKDLEKDLMNALKGVGAFQDASK